MELLRRENYPLLISDDIKFVKKEEKEERISFSTILIFLLYKKGKIKKKKAIDAIDSIFDKREWSKNIIYIDARELLKE